MSALTIKHFKGGMKERINEFRLSTLIKYGVLIGLTIYTAQIIIKGPICEWSRNSTIIRENHLNLSGKFISYRSNKRSEKMDKHNKYFLI